MATLSEAITLAHQLIGFDTRNPGSTETECINFISWLLRNSGFKVITVNFAEKRPSLVARLREGKRPALCFVGHVDTVPLGEASWKFNPFAGEIHNGRLYGRGASDMKSGIAAMVTAACRLALRLAADDDLILVIAASEETGCQGSRYLASQPDLLGNAGALIVGEPTGNYPLIGHKGALWLKAKFAGRTAHGSMPEKGDNAVYKAVEAVELLRNFDFGVKHHPNLGAPSLNVGYIHGGLNINSVPDAAEVGIDIRTTPELANEELIIKIGEYLRPDATIIPLVDVAAIWTDPKLPWVKTVFDTVAPFLGTHPEPKTVAFFTDGAPLQNAFGGVPTLILGPGASSIAHQTDEYCQLAEIDAATAIYERIAEKWYNLPTSG
jgi:succinyl-diaminopimelate desuccinylase